MTTSKTRCFGSCDGEWVDWRDTVCVLFRAANGDPRHKHFCRDCGEVFRALRSLMDIVDGTPELIGDTRLDDD